MESKSSNYFHLRDEFCNNKNIVLFTLKSKGGMSCTELSLETEIPQKTLCYLKRRLEASNIVKAVKRKYCSITGRRVQLIELV